MLIFMELKLRGQLPGKKKRIGTMEGLVLERSGKYEEMTWDETTWEPQIGHDMFLVKCKGTHGHDTPFDAKGARVREIAVNMPGVDTAADVTVKIMENGKEHLLIDDSVRITGPDRHVFDFKKI